VAPFPPRYNLNRRVPPSSKKLRVDRTIVALIKDLKAFGLFDTTVNPVHVRDYHATILHLMGIDQTRRVYRYAGRDFRLTDVDGNVIKSILS
jgi:hypothetical protein